MVKRERLQKHIRLGYMLRMLENSSTNDERQQDIIKKHKPEWYNNQYLELILQSI